MSLVPDYSGSSSSDSNDSDNSNAADKDNKEKVNKTTLLPSASALLGAASKKSNTPMGVFSNPYFEAESTKQAALEKHVKMIKRDEYIVEKNGKKICWNNRRGRCHYGNKCQYAHDSDIVQEDPSNSHNAETHSSLKAGETLNTHGHSAKRKHTGSSSLPAKRYS